MFVPIGHPFSVCHHVSFKMLDGKCFLNHNRVFGSHLSPATYIIFKDETSHFLINSPSWSNFKISRTAVGEKNK
jgi:hypothetical protein